MASVLDGQILPKRKQPVAAGGGGGIAFDASSTNSYSVASQTTITNSHTIAGSSRAIVVWVCMAGGGTATITGVTVDGVSATEIMEDELDGGGVDVRLAGYVLIAPNTGTVNIIATCSASPAGGYLAMAATSWTGVNQTGGAGNSWRSTPPIDGGNGADSPSIAVSNSQSGDVVVAGIHNYGANLSAPSGTNRGIANGIAGSAYDFAHQSTVASGTTTTSTWTGDIYWTGGAVALIPQ